MINGLINTLSRNGITCYFVGGYVRDTLLGIPSHDYDLVVNKPIEYVQNILISNGYKIVDTGKKFGVIGVMIDGHKIDIAEFRADTYEYGNRKPVISKATDIYEDLKRRDFTVNSMAIRCDTGELIDPYNAKEDLEKKVLKTIRPADEVFKEDPLRMLRAVRFSAKYGFNYDYLKNYIYTNVHLLKFISAERIQEELLKGFESNPAEYFDNLVQSGAWEYIFPEYRFADTIIHDHRGHHYGESLFKHSKDTVSRLNSNDPFLRLIAVLHDIGKTKTMTRVENKIQFVGHDKAGAEMVETVLRRLKFSNYYINLGRRIVENHLYFSNNPSKNSFAKFFIEQNEDIDFIRKLVLIAEADQKANYNDYLKMAEAFSKTPPVISGKDIMAVQPLNRAKALKKARYYQLINAYPSKSTLISVIITESVNGNL